MSAGAEPLLRVENLSVHFPMRRDGPFAPRRVLRAVDGVSFGVPRGASFGIVGESGSGKSTTALAVMRLVAMAAGRLHMDGTDVGQLDGEALRRFRRRMQMIFQDPYSALPPRARVGDIIREPLDIQGIGSNAEREARLEALVAMVGLRPEAARAFPHQFSGGQRQRIGIARALATDPDLVVCDEPVSALDVAIQAQVLNLLKRLQRERGLTYVFISHDLGVIRFMCDRVAVMYLGRIVETGPTRAIFRHPAHPYTEALLRARPSIRRPRIGGAVFGEASGPADAEGGCRFAGRCPRAEPRCRADVPALRPIAEGRAAACHFPAPPADA